MSKLRQGNTYKLDDLEVYQLAKKLAVYVYEVSKDFPKEEQFGLTSQIRRCVSSIGANLAEGYGRYHYNDRIRFYYISRGSLSELLFHIELAYELEYISKEDLNNLVKKIKDLRIKLNNYIKYLKNKD
jgi:four helix bundle protein